MNYNLKSQCKGGTDAFTILLAWVQGKQSKYFKKELKFKGVKKPGGRIEGAKNWQVGSWVTYLCYYLKAEDEMYLQDANLGLSQTNQ